MKGEREITVAVAAVTILSLIALGGVAVTASTDDGETDDGLEKEYTDNHGDVLVDLTPDESGDSYAVSVGVESLTGDDESIERYEIALEYDDDRLEFDDVDDYGPVKPAVDGEDGVVTIERESDVGADTPEELFVAEFDLDGDLDDASPIENVDADLEYVPWGAGLTDLTWKSHETVANYTPATGVEGTITGENGEEIEGASIGLEAENETGDVNAAETETDGNGSYDLWIDAGEPTVDAELSISHDDYDDVSQSLELTAGEPTTVNETLDETITDDVRLSVTPAETGVYDEYAVGVESLTDDEQTIERYEITLEYDDDRDFAGLSGYGLEEPTDVDDEDGTVTVTIEDRTEIETPAQLFVAEFEDDEDELAIESADADLEYVSWGLGLTDLTWSSYDTGTYVGYERTVSGQVTDDDGEEIEGANVTISTDENADTAIDENVTDGDGQYELVAGADSYHVTATADGYAQTTTDVDLTDGDEELDIVLDSADDEEDEDESGDSDPGDGDNTVGPDDPNDGDGTTGPDDGDGDADGDNGDADGDNGDADDGDADDGASGDGADDGDADSDDDDAGDDGESDAASGFGTVLAILGVAISTVALLRGSAARAR